tara:strand:- start:7689 stop:8777 length:1089 start_codon:yes stop_codon:yes gene_type:complete
MPKIRPIIKNGKPCFEIDFGMVAGKKRRRYEPSLRKAREVARDFEDQRRKLGLQWVGLEPRAKWTTLEVLAEIKECGLTIKEVWETYQKTHLTNAGTTIEAALAEFLEVKGQSGRRSRYTEELARVLNRFAQGREKRRISSVSAQELRSWLAGLDASQSTKQTVQNRVSALFGWAYRQGYTKENPCEKLEKIRLDQADPEILTVKQCQNLIQATRQADPDFLPYFALALFEGIRPEECARLSAKDIDLDREQVTVSGEAAKTRNRRIVPLLPPALSILSKCPKSRWFDWQTNFRRRRDALRKAAKLKKWPKDVLRHTAASHFYNIYGMDEATKALGHSAAIMLRHYRQMQTKEETKTWLKIM